MRRPDGVTVWTLPTGHLRIRPPLPALHTPRVVPAGEPYRLLQAGRAPEQDEGAAGMAALAQAVEGPAQHRPPRQPPAGFEGEPPF